MFKSLAHNVDDKQRTNDVYVSENVDFAGMLLSQDILNGLNAAGFKKPSPIQLKAIPLAMCGFDLIVQSKSGTGKTAVFSIIALESINTQIKDTQVLILTPTREIAVQIQHVLNTIGSTLKDFNAEYFIGGLPVAEDKQKLFNKNIHIAIGAPGRIKSLIENKHLKTKKIKLFILDEADKLMYESFKDDIDFIFKSLPQSKQIIATSATYTNELNNLVAQYMKSPTKISVETDIPTLLGLKQFISLVTRHLNIVRQIQYKTNELTRILSTVPFKQCIVFTNYQIRAESLCNELNKTGWPSTFIAASQTQEQRLKALKKLKNHECRLLISTDLIARGIDAENVNLVINYDVPYDGATYLHRIGRAGRYGTLGLCITICCNGDEYTKFKSLIGMISNDIELLKLPENGSMPSNLWKCDNKNFEKISFDGLSNSYEIQSDSLLKLSDLQLEADVNSRVKNHLKSSNISQIEVNQENSNKYTNESVIIDGETEATRVENYLKSANNPQNQINQERIKNGKNEFVLNDEEISDFGKPMIQDLSSTPESLKIKKEKLLKQEKNVALLAISNLLLNSSNIKFESFSYFKNLIKLKSKLNDSKSFEPQKFDDENKNIITNENQKISKPTTTNGFKSFAELKSSFANHKNIVPNAADKFDSKLTGNHEETLDVNRNENYSPEISESEKKVNNKFKNTFKSFAELKTSIADHQHINDIQNGVDLDKIETKGFKSHEKLTNGSTFSNVVDETLYFNGNYPSGKSESENSGNKPLENGLKLVDDFKMSDTNRHNCNENQNVTTLNKNKEESTEVEIENNLYSVEKNCQKTQINENSPEIISESLNLQSTYINIDKVNILKDQEKSNIVEIENNLNLIEKNFQKTKINEDIVSKLSYLLSLLQNDKEIYIENKLKLKNLNYKIILDALLNNKPITLENLTKNGKFVRIIESKVVIDSKSNKKSYKTSEQSKLIDDSRLRNDLQNSEIKNHETSQFYYDPSEKISDEFVDFQNNFPDYSNSKFDYGNSRFSACATCKCTCNAVRDNTNYQPNYHRLHESNYHQTNVSNSSYYGNNYYNSWYNMWREQISHIRNHVQQTIYMREMDKYNQ